MEEVGLERTPRISRFRNSDGTTVLWVEGRT